MNSMHASRRLQRGFTLVTTMIFLMIFMISATSMVGASLSDIKVANNEQFQFEAQSVAQEGIEYVVSQPFTQTLITSTTPVPVKLYSSTTATYTAQVAAPVCDAITPVLGSSLNPNVATDVACEMSSKQSSYGQINSGTNTNTPCSDTQWDVQSSVTDASVSGTAVVLHQGISARMFTPSALAECH